jgi:hypothetical protein
VTNAKCNERWFKREDMHFLVKAHPSAGSLAVDVRFDENMMYVRLLDGREIGAPLEWFPTLRDASPEQRNKLRLVGRGIGIHWEDLDEDISVAGLLSS